jgi:hypothetical protein
MGEEGKTCAGTETACSPVLNIGINLILPRYDPHSSTYYRGVHGGERRWLTMQKFTKRVMIITSALSPCRLHLGSGLAPSSHPNNAPLHTRSPGLECRNNHLRFILATLIPGLSIACVISTILGTRMRRLTEVSTKRWGGSGSAG